MFDRKIADGVDLGGVIWNSCHKIGLSIREGICPYIIEDPLVAFVENGSGDGSAVDSGAGRKDKAPGPSQLVIMVIGSIGADCENISRIGFQVFGGPDS
jgi:hypothetical protein